MSNDDITVGKLLLELMRIYVLHGDLRVWVKGKHNTFGTAREITIHADIPYIVYITQGKFDE